MGMLFVHWYILLLFFSILQRTSIESLSSDSQPAKQSSQPQQPKTVVSNEFVAANTTTPMIIIQDIPREEASYTVNDDGTIYETIYACSTNENLPQQQ